MRGSISLIVGLLFLSAGTGAQAQMAYPGPGPGPEPIAGSSFQNYVGLRGSYAFAGNKLSSWAPTSPPTQLRASLGGGGGGSFYLGTRLPLNLRLELEALYRYQPLSSASIGGITVPAAGRQQYAAPMLNLLWDFPMPEDSLLRPFVGMGVGAAWTDTLANDPAGDTLRSNKWNLAYSFIAGLAMPLSDSSRVTAMYRWMQVRDANFNCSTGGLTARCLDTNLNSSSVDLGFEMDL